MEAHKSAARDLSQELLWNRNEQELVQNQITESYNKGADQTAYELEEHLHFLIANERILCDGLKRIGKRF